METLIEVVNQLQDVFSITGSSGQDLELPQILVVGAQSSGKSSVLEHLVGKSFLPRGAGVVTRCPLLLQMMQSPASKKIREYACFNHSDEVFTDYDAIRKEIEEQTERLAGTNKGISDLAIVLKMYSASFVDLTLIDLPGITKVPVGDQPADIEEQTRELILKYAKNPNSIILAVSAANADMATSESIKLAREVDPAGERTLAIITKVDLMDEGTDAREMLSGKIIPVKLGIIGVVNRSQKDIMDNKSVLLSLKDEEEFFDTKYKDIAEQHGTKYLKKAVQSILINHIQKCLPKLKEQIHEKLLNAERELKGLGEDDADRYANLLDLLTKFTQSFCSAIQGNSADIKTTELCGGAKINHVFQDKLSKSLNSIEAVQGLSKDAVQTANKNASGASPGLLVNPIVFEQLVKQQITRLREPTLRCADLVLNELLVIVETCSNKPDLGLDKYPKLHQQLEEILQELLRAQVPVTKEKINELIDAQLAYINTAHPDFYPNQLLPAPTDQNDAQNSHSKKNSNHMSNEGLQRLQVPQDANNLDKADRDYMLILELIKSYYTIVLKIIQDQTPKLIMLFMVNNVTGRLQTELVTRLYKNGDSSVMEESPDIVERRRKLHAEVNALRKANATFNKLKPNLSSVVKKELSQAQCNLL